MTFDAVADELYGLAPGDFVATRNARAKEISAAGNKADAAEVRRLAKPSPSAFLVNALVRRDPNDVDRLLALRSSFHKAQETGTRDRLRALSLERQSLIETLVARARDVADRGGQALTSSVQREIERTLEAAVADEEAARAVREGRLVRALAHVGFGGLDLSAPPHTATAHARRTSESAPRSAGSSRDARRREQEAKKRLAVLRAAEGRLEDARRRHRAADADNRKATGVLGRTERELGRAAEALARATADYERARDRHEGAQD